MERALAKANNPANSLASTLLLVRVLHRKQHVTNAGEASVAQLNLQDYSGRGCRHINFGIELLRLNIITVHVFPVGRHVSSKRVHYSWKATSLYQSDERSSWTQAAATLTSISPLTSCETSLCICMSTLKPTFKEPRS